MVLCTKQPHSFRFQALFLAAAAALSVTSHALAQATIDESPFAKGGNGVVLYVSQSPAASDKNTGKDQHKPLATIGHAVALARDLTNTSPVKIKVGVGTYREGFQIIGGSKLLEIEGAVPGKVIVSGSQAKGWELSKWTPVAGVPGLYKKAWPYKFGLTEPMGSDQGVHYPNLAVFRREAVYVNGAGLTPVQLENFVFDFTANPRYVYKGYRDPVTDPSVIPTGAYSVSDQKDDHTDAHTVFMRLPAGVDPKTATIEVPDDSLVSGPQNGKKLLVEVARGNLVLRNLSFQHAACFYNFACVGANLNVFGDNPKDFLKNMLFENCDFNWNNGIGLSLTSCQYFTIRHCRALHNGCGGISPWYDFNMLMEDNDTSYNAWTALLGSDGWVPAGSKGMIKDSIIRRETSNHNGYLGFWLDFGYKGNNGGNTFEDCDFSYNHGHGILLEIATGPNYIKNCRMVGNSGNGIESSYQARQTYIDHCVLLNNGNQFSCVAQASGNAVAEGRNGNPDDVLCTKMTNCVLASDKDAGLINFYNDNGFLTNVKTLADGKSRFQASGNTYWSASPKVFKAIWWDGNVALADWEKKTGQDSDSKWEKPDFATLLAQNPTVPKRTAVGAH